MNLNTPGFSCSHFDSTSVSLGPVTITLGLPGPASVVSTVRYVSCPTGSLSSSIPGPSTLQFNGLPTAIDRGSPRGVPE